MNLRGSLNLYTDNSFTSINCNNQIIYIKASECSALQMYVVPAVVDEEVKLA